MFFDSEISGDKVDYKILKTLLVEIMLFSQIHCQKVLKLKHISFVALGLPRRTWDPLGARASRAECEAQ
jgi:hypothetical protein